MDKGEISDKVFLKYLKSASRFPEGIIFVVNSDILGRILKGEELMFEAEN